MISSRIESDMTDSCNVAIGLIDFHTLDRPESVFESRGVVLHVIIAGVGEGGAVGTCVPLCSGPVAAEVCIEDLVGGGLVTVLAVAHCKRGQERKEGNYNGRCTSMSRRTICMSAKWVGISQFP